MLRDRSSSETLLTYATFFALSVAIHMLLILGTRSEPAPQRPEQPRSTARAQGEGR